MAKERNWLELPFNVFCLNNDNSAPMIQQIYFVLFLYNKPFSETTSHCITVLFLFSYHLYHLINNQNNMTHFISHMCNLSGILMSAATYTKLDIHIKDQTQTFCSSLHTSVETVDGCSTQNHINNTVYNIQ